MKKRVLSLTLALVLAVGLLPVPAAAVTIVDDEVFLTQQTNYTCTLVSAVMMLRRKGILDGDAGWSGITEAAVRPYAWTSGLLWNFTYNGLSVTTYHLDSNGIRGLEAKRQYLLHMLEQHPEGIVVYNHNRPHAILLTDYDSETDTFYCADPGKLAYARRVPLCEATIPGSGQEAKLNGIHQVWYITSGTSNGAGTMPVEDTDLLSGLEEPAGVPEAGAPDGAAPAAAEPLFADVPVDAWFAGAVAWAVEAGITSGAGDGSTFFPDADCSVGEVLTFLWRAKGEPEPAIENPYTDVADTAFYYKPALWAYEQGMVTGTELGAAEPCTRSMAVTYLWQTAGAPPFAVPVGFDDVPAGTSYAHAVSWAVEQDIAEGTGEGTFSPDMACSRAQIATFLYRVFGEGSDTPDTQGELLTEPLS